MSEDYRFYVEKMAALGAAHIASGPLRSQVEELLVFVRECEARWDRESRRSVTGEWSGDR